MTESAIPIQHSHILTSSNRSLFYYTFVTPEELTEPTNRHPILYFHGFPGCGLEGSICSSAAAKSNCEVYSFDRPGFGNSDPPPVLKNDPSSSSPEELVTGFVDDVWDFIRHRTTWDRFSIVAVSGGGPYALAFLESYLSLLDDTEQPPSSKLTAMALVAGVYCPAGVDQMMPSNRQLCQLVSQNSRLSNMALRIMFSLPGLFVRLPFLRNQWVLNLMGKDLPQADKELVCEPESSISKLFLEIAKEATKQGSKTASMEANILFQTREYEFSKKLKERCQKKEEGEKNFDGFPKVVLFHGGLDVNVPIAHSRYVYKEIFNESSFSKLNEYPDLGHISLAVHKAEEYIREVNVSNTSEEGE